MDQILNQPSLHNFPSSSSRSLIPTSAIFQPILIMVHLSFMLNTLLLSLPLLSLASPLQSRGLGVPHYKPSRYMSGLPQNATHLSFDTETGELTAYDITHRVLGKQHHSPNTTPTPRTVGSCAAMVNADVQKCGCSRGL